MPTGLVTTMAQRTIRAVARRVERRELDVVAEGVEHVPAVGPVVIAPRHVHHLYDGVALLSVVRRPLHVLVALDWARGRAERTVMEWATRAARWPALLRTDALALRPDGVPRNGGSAFGTDEVLGYQRRALRDAARLLLEGAALVVFPEGYPNVDPRWTPKRSFDERLPFRAGFASLVAQVCRRHRLDVPIVPVGLAYRPGPRWHVTVRCGTPFEMAPAATPEATARAVEARVAALSSLACSAFDGGAGGSVAGLA
jgi:putative membrane protein